MPRHSDYAVKPTAEIRDDICAAVRNTLEGVRADSAGDDVFDLATGKAAALQEAYGHLQAATDEAFPDTASYDNLVRHARRHIGDPLAATKAVGLVAGAGAFYVTGTIAATWSDGDTFIHQETAQRYEATAGGELVDAGDGTGAAYVPVEAIVAGDAGALATGEAVLWESQPVGIAATATVNGNMTGGTDAEKQAHYLDRYHLSIENPAAGGTAADFKNWALGVEGVGFAEAFPYRRDVGTCDVAVLDMEGDNVTAAVLSAVQDALDENRPVCAAGDPDAAPPLEQPLAVHPVLTDVDFTFGLNMAKGYEFSDTPSATVQEGSSSRTIRLIDTTGFEVGQWVAFRDLRRARKISAVDATADTLTLATPLLDADGEPVAPSSGDLVMPGCPTYDTLAEAIETYFAEIRIGASYYESKGRATLTNQFEVLDATQSPTGNVTALVDETTVQALRIGTLILQTAS
ncbi:MAG: baseplate J/gp47 family protein [Candidatus Lernaella stagnicola]|nr:baseplate J/gp47 family protein [Candidatus Lernaella stagnicola]